METAAPAKRIVVSDDDLKQHLAGKTVTFAVQQYFASDPGRYVLQEEGFSLLEQYMTKRSVREVLAKLESIATSVSRRPRAGTASDWLFGF